MKPLVIYTANVDGKDLLLPPKHRIEGVDYVCFTNTPQFCRSGFELRPLPFDEGSPRRNARKIKILAHELFPDYERSIWIDSTKQIIADLRPLMEEAFSSHPIAAFSHADRDCLFAEIGACIKYGRTDPQVLLKQQQAYEQKGLPRGWGLPTTFVLFRKHHDSKLQQVMQSWWQHLQHYSERDQISLPAALMAHDCSLTYLDIALHDRYFKHHGHLWHPKGDNRNRWQFWQGHRLQRLICQHPFYIAWKLRQNA